MERVGSATTILRGGRQLRRRPEVSRLFGDELVRLS